MAEEVTKNKIASHCDARCQYAIDASGDCDCECGGKNHGQGADPMVREKQAQRHSKTRRHFKDQYNEEHGIRAAQRLYRKDRAEFNKLYAAFAGVEENKLNLPSKKKAPEVEAKFEVIKESGEFQHVRYPNKKTAYLQSGKVITKAQLPVELGW